MLLSTTNYLIFFVVFLQWQPNINPTSQLSIIPWQGPFHVSFNAQQNVITIYRFLFEPMYKAIFGQRKVLAKKPKPYRISTLLTACFGGWLLIRESVIAHFGSSYKSTEFLILIHILEEIVPLVFYFYPVIFRKGNYQEYKDSLVRMAIMFIIHCRRHYDKATIAQLSDLKHYETNIPLLEQVQKEALNSLTEKKVEVFHSILRRYKNNIRE